MALIQCSYFSSALGMNTDMYAILPESTEGMIGQKGSDLSKKFPVLYLLHGLSDDHSIWLRRTSIERYVSALGIAVIMPNCHRSFYSNMVKGYAYWDHISQEVPQKAEQFFRISTHSEDRHVAGLSMGGYGAFKLALSLPDRYATASSLSGVLDLATVHQEKEFPADLNLVFGEGSIKDSSHDLLYLLSQLPPEQSPKLYQCCGEQDFLWQSNLNFLEQAKKYDFDVTWECEAGDHNWDYWDQKIKVILNRISDYSKSL